MSDFLGCNEHWWGVWNGQTSPKRTFSIFRPLCVRSCQDSLKTQLFSQGRWSFSWTKIFPNPIRYPASLWLLDIKMCTLIRSTRVLALSTSCSLRFRWTVKTILDSRLSKRCGFVKFVKKIVGLFTLFHHCEQSEIELRAVCDLARSGDRHVVSFLRKIADRWLDQTLTKISSFVHFYVWDGTIDCDHFELSLGLHPWNREQRIEFCSERFFWLGHSLLSHWPRVHLQYIWNGIAARRPCLWEWSCGTETFHFLSWKRLSKFTKNNNRKNTGNRQHIQLAENLSSSVGIDTVMAVAVWQYLWVTVSVLLSVLVALFLCFTAYIFYIRRKFAHIPGPPVDK